MGKGARWVSAHGPARPRGHPTDHSQGQRLDAALSASVPGREPPQGAVCLIDAEVVCCDEKGMAAFHMIRHRRNEPEAFLYAFDLLELNWADLRREPIEVHKARWRAPCARAGVLASTIRPPARAIRPYRYARSRCTETGGPREVGGRARAIASRASCAPRTDDRSASSLAGRPCLIIGVRECRRETGNIVLRASVEATSVVGDRARVRRF
jgi:hypothetical protein